MSFNYFRQQMNRLRDSENYRIKITSDSGETNWLRVDPDKFNQIAAILEEGEDEDTPIDPETLTLLEPRQQVKFDE